MPPYAQVVVGPPGAGKSTYCNGMNQFLNSIGRHSQIVNLDPANDRLPYDENVTLDIRDYITLEEIMSDADIALGPNGGLIYALETFENSMDHFIEQLGQIITTIQNSNKQNDETCYLIIDCPGQIELYTSNDVMGKILKRLIKRFDFRICVVNLVDCVNLVKPSQYISILLLTLRSMLQMDLPQVNILSKIDMLKGYADTEVYRDEEDVKRGLPFNLEYYTRAEELQYLIPFIETEENNPRASFFKQKYQNLTACIADLIEDYHLISYQVLAIEDKQSMINLLSVIDKANGYVFGSNELGGDTIWQDAVRQSGTGGYSLEIDIQERWIDRKEEFDQLDRKNRQELVEQLNKKEPPLNKDEEWESALKEWERNNNKSFLK